MKSNLTVPEAAELLRTSESTILRLIEKSALRAINIGAGAERSRWIITTADIDDFIRRRANAPPPRVRAEKKSTVPSYVRDK